MNQLQPTPVKNAQNDRILRYVEIYAKDLVAQLARNWNPERLPDLHATLCDYLKILDGVQSPHNETQPEISANQDEASDPDELDEMPKEESDAKAEAVQAKQITPRRRLYPAGTRPVIVELMLDTIESGVKNGTKRFHFKGSDLGVTDDWLYKSVIQRFNYLKEVERRFPDLRISYRQDPKGGFWIVPGRRDRNGSNR